MARGTPPRFHLHHLAGPAPRTLIFTPIHTMPTPRTCMDSTPSPRAPTATRAAHTEHALLEPLTPELHGTPSPIYGRGHSCPPHAPTFRGTPPHTHPGEASQPSRASGSRQPLAAVHATSTRPAPGGRRHAVRSRHRLVGQPGRCAQPRRLLRAPPSASPRPPASSLPIWEGGRGAGGGGGGGAGRGRMTCERRA